MGTESRQFAEAFAAEHPWFAPKDKEHRVSTLSASVELELSSLRAEAERLNRDLAAARKEAASMRGAAGACLGQTRSAEDAADDAEREVERLKKERDEARCSLAETKLAYEVAAEDREDLRAKVERLKREAAEANAELSAIGSSLDSLQMPSARRLADGEFMQLPVSKRVSVLAEIHVKARTRIDELEGDLALSAVKHDEARAQLKDSRRTAMEEAAGIAESIAHEQSVVAEEKAEDAPGSSEMHALESMLCRRVAVAIRAAAKEETP